MCVGVDWRGTHATYRIHDIRTKIELVRYVEQTGGTYSVPSSVTSFFDLHKDEHKLLVDDPDTEVHRPMTLPVITI